MNRTTGALSLGVIAIVAACSSASVPGAGTGTGTGTGIITGQGNVPAASGGKVATADGALTVDVPPGALAADTQITIAEIAPLASGAIGKTYEIGPSGTQFTIPVALVFDYRAFDLAGNDPVTLEAATIVSGAWAPITSSEVDVAAHVVTGHTTHLSPFGLHSKGKGPADDAGADAADGGPGPTDAGPSDAPSDAPFDASGCTQVAQQVGSCMNHPVQVCTVGKVFTSCTDTAPMGYRAYCCPP